MANFTIQVKGLDKIEKKFSQAGKIIDKHNRPAMEKSVNFTQDNVQSFAPELSGRLKSQIDGEVKGMGGDLMGIVRPSPSISKDVYPYVVEFGRGGGMPPPAAIAQKMGVGINEAFLIARAIGRGGHKKFEYMKRGWEKSKDRISDFFNKSLRDIVRELDS